MPRVPVSVVIPIHNEAGILADAVARLRADIGDEVEIILAENGSTDRTAEIGDAAAAAHPNTRILHLAAPDYGAAMRDGFAAATGDWVFNFDIDYFSGDFLRSAIRSEADIVLASKRAPGASDTRGAPRRLATWGFNLLLRALFRSRVTDTHGMKGIRRAVVDDIAPRVTSTKDLFDTELVLRAERAGYRIEEVPAHVVELREARTRIWSRVPRTIAGLLRLRMRLWGERRR